MRIEVVVFDGVDELDAIGPFEVLQNARQLGADVEAAIVSYDGAEEVVASHGLRIRPEGKLGERGRPDVVVVPGGGWVSRSPKGARAEAERGVLPELLAGLHREGATLACVCTGGMLVARAGLTLGRPAVTHHGALTELRAAGAEVIEARVVDDGDLITAGGVTSGLDLALWLVEREFGAALAHRIERGLEYERRGTVWRRSG